ncbi:hypothetical protein [Cryobacterium sp. Y57]|uniref:hypothetical protein n=1 Tax=Cryobacterium sp. Y57 TaxID=2048287 RepID=UPI0013049887|nr:hypothetical protein [Cryobacterium sp. Y57]
MTTEVITVKKPLEVLSQPRRRFYRRVGLQQVLTVAVTLILLELVVFGDYFSGANTPQFDFVGYSEEAFAWWNDGTFFSPAQWMPYMWGGYPAVSNLQNSSFYLPVGLIAGITPFNLTASACLSALHVAFGALGAYMFARAFGLRHFAALLGLVGWFFVIGNYSNAAQLDIMRAYSWVPWIFLVISPRWPWRSWWAYPIAALILWQAALGIYPGMLIAGVYASVTWVAFNQFLYRPRFRTYLLPIVLVGSAAVAMTMLRFLPAINARGYYPAVLLDTSHFNFHTLSTFFFPPQNIADGLDTFGLYFLPVPLFVLLVFVPWRSLLAKALISVLLVSVLIGVPFWPWHDLVQLLPGMSLSRFRASDFKVFILFAICMLAVMALNEILRSRDSRTSPMFTALSRTGKRPPRILRSFPWQTGMIFLLVLGVICLGLRYSPLNPANWLIQAEILIASAAIVIFSTRRTKMISLKTAAGALVFLSLISGTHYVYSISNAWTVSRSAVEEANLGESVDSLIQERIPVTTSPGRPARIAPPEPPSDLESIARHYGSAFYTGDDSFFGYVNLRGTQTYEMIKVSAYLPDELGVASRKFWTASGIVVESVNSQLPSVATTAACVADGLCGPNLRSIPLAYSAGSFVYGVESAVNIRVILNDAHYVGWSAQVCPPTGSRGDCMPVHSERGPSGEIAVDLPKGHWQLKLDYTLPGQRTSWILFWGGVGVVALSSIGAGLLSSRRGRTDRVPNRD